MAGATTANDRFKQSSRSSFWISLIVATVLHVVLFAGSPVVALEVDPRDDAPVVAVNVPDDVRLPEPPPPIRPPVAPLISAAVPDDATMNPYDLEDWKERPLDPPPASSDADRIGPVITPMEVAPRLLNGEAVQRALTRHYPPVLREAGVGGVVAVWFHIDERGRVMETRIHRSSGYDDLDEAALLVADRMEFSPASNRDVRVPVWVSLQIVFEVR